MLKDEVKKYQFLLHSIFWWKRETERQIDGETERQIDGETEEQRDRETEKQKEKERKTVI